MSLTTMKTATPHLPDLSTVKSDGKLDGKSGEQNPETSFPRSRQIVGLLDTAHRNIRNLTCLWEFQLLSNTDIILRQLESKLSPEDFKAIDLQFEEFVKQPLRQQMGRLRAATRSLEEIKNLTVNSVQNQGA